MLAGCIRVTLTLMYHGLFVNSVVCTCCSRLSSCIGQVQWWLCHTDFTILTDSLRSQGPGFNPEG